MTEHATNHDRSGVLGRFRSRATAPDPTDVIELDPLTGLATRAVLEDWIVQATALSRVSSSHCVLAFVDLSALRDVNDSFGPDVGDRVLIESAERLGALGLNNPHPLRWGGAEFAVVFERVDHVGGPDAIAHAVLEHLGEPYEVGGDRVTVACNVGLAIGGDASGTPADLVRDAHQALVQARTLGPGGYAVHDESRRGRYSTRIDEARLHDALDNQEFLLHYQPIIRTDTREVIGVEALLRWQAPGATNTGMLFPHDFLPLLEKSGLIVPVGRWVVEEACRQVAVWDRDHRDLPPLFVTCNLGARELEMPDFADAVLAIVERTGTDPRQLCLDITEQTLRYNGAGTWSALRHLKQAGVKLGLDDFGTGTAGLEALRDLSLDLLRIDRRFVDNLVSSAEDRAIVRNVTNLAHDLEMITAVEGVEEDEQADLLGSLGVDLAQGFLFGRPEAPDKLDRLLGAPEAEDDVDGDDGHRSEGAEADSAIETSADAPMPGAGAPS